MTLGDLTGLDFSTPLVQWGSAVSLTVVVLLLLLGVKARVGHVLGRLTEKRAQPLFGFLAALLSRTKILVLFLLSLWVGLGVVSVPPRFSEVFGRVVLFAVLLQFAFWADALVAYYIGLKAELAKEQDVSRTTAFSVIKMAARVVLWSIVALLLLDNLGVNVSALVAGLGVGGIAVALAVQNVLGDLLCSISIILDKPFSVGDFIIVGDKLGVVEKIGIKSTRLRSLFGEQLIFSNSDLISSRIQNYKTMSERRITFGLGVVYQTPADKLAAIPEMLKEIVGAVDKVRFDRAHFKDFGDSALNFEIVYYVLSGDYNEYMDIQQEINLKIFRSFEAEGLEFAYPTQTLWLEKTAVG